MMAAPMLTAQTNITVHIRTYTQARMAWAHRMLRARIRVSFVLVYDPNDLGGSPRLPLVRLPCATVTLRRAASRVRVSRVCVHVSTLYGTVSTRCIHNI
jgi:hypothetical protein